MLEHFTNLSSEHWFAASLSLVPGIVSVYVLWLAWFRMPRSGTRDVFMLLLLTTAMFQLCEGMMKLSADEADALFWNACANIAVAFTGAASVDFALTFTEYDRVGTGRKFQVILYIPSVIYALAHVAGYNGSLVTESAIWGWIPVSPTDSFGIFIMLWLSFLGLVTLALLALHVFRTKKGNKEERRRAQIILVGYSIPAIQGIATQVIMPQFFGAEPIPLTSTSLLAFSVGAFVALKRYRLFVFSPELAIDQIMKNINQAIVIVDNDDYLQYANNRFYELTGYSKTEAKGKKLANLILGERERERMKVRNRSRRRYESEEYELQIITKDGKTVDILQYGMPYYNSKREVIGSIGMMADISDKKKAREAVMNALIEGQEKERKRIAQELHDGFGQLLASIHIYAQSLEDEGKESIAMIRRLSEMAVKEYRSISHNLLPPALEGSGLQEALKDLCERWDSGEVKVTFRPDESLDKISQMQQMELYRVAQELLNNALKHAKATAIGLSLSTKDNEVLLAVEDNGIGIDENILTGHKSGIGFKNVQARISALEGQLKVYVSEQKGTRIEIKLPLSAS